MSKTDQMRALREAKFARSSAGASRRVSPAPAAAAMSRSSRSAAPTPKPASSIDVAVEAASVEGVAVEAVVSVPAGADPIVAEPALIESSSAITPSFEVPTLDIPLPVAVPKVRDTPNPAFSARAAETPPAPASEQIIIPALDLPAPRAEVSEPTSSPEGAVESGHAANVAGHGVATGHGVAPGQPIAAYRHEDLVAVVNWVGQDGLPRDSAALVAAVMTELGFKRKGRKITDAITAAAISTGALVAQPEAPDLDIPAMAS